MIKIKCIICDEEIEKPRIEQLCCDKQSCKDEFNSNQINLWKMEHGDRVKDSNKRAYIARKTDMLEAKVTALENNNG